MTWSWSVIDDPDGCIDGGGSCAALDEALTAVSMWCAEYRIGIGEGEGWRRYTGRIRVIREGRVGSIMLEADDGLLVDAVALLTDADMAVYDEWTDREGLTVEVGA